MAMIKNELGEFLRKIRMEVYDEGVKKFAKRLDIPAWTYRSIEEGRTVHPQKETIDKIEKALHIKISMMNFEELLLQFSIPIEKNAMYQACNSKRKD